jgi:hypothetical protein
MSLFDWLIGKPASPIVRDQQQERARADELYRQQAARTLEHAQELRRLRARTAAEIQRDAWTGRRYRRVR